MIEIGIALIGVLAGVMSGLFGIGGGIVMVPTMIAIFGMDMLSANATSLTAMLLPVGILGVINYYKAGLVNLRDSLWISLGLLLGSFFGAELALSVDIALLAKLYAAFLLYVVLSYFSVFSFLFKHKTVEPAFENANATHNYSVWLFIILGIGAGVIAGMFGKGGGIVIVPILTRFFRYSPKMATATSLAALQLPVGLPGVIAYSQTGHLNWLFAALMAGGIVVGAFFGSKAAIKLPSAMFKKVYAVFLAIVAVYMVVKYI